MCDYMFECRSWKGLNLTSMALGNTAEGAGVMDRR